MEVVKNLLLTAVVLGVFSGIFIAATALSFLVWPLIVLAIIGVFVYIIIDGETSKRK